MTLSREQWERIKDLFDRALALPPTERHELVGREAFDETERHEVETLLHSLENDPDFLEDTPAADAASLLAATDDPMIGRVLGAWRITGEIARGGMGRVYLGERSDTYRKRVAIKIVKRGMDTEEVLRRFAYERQVLATLDHPNIAKILDGGATDDGLPYLVMDYIEGRSIDDYCAEKALSIDQRLALFLQICDAVAYAHRSLVIHRDLKPANIIIRPDGSAVLLDFGIAKVLDPHVIGVTGASTALGPGPMTPEYASPEQLLGGAITTASDVYSLGIILFELLTGSRFARLDVFTPESIHRLATAEPVPPSAAVLHRTEIVEDERRRISRALRGDLDTIVLHALEKDPVRRYTSVDQLAEDLRRRENALPLIARPSRWSYRAGKFVRRHRVGVAVATVLLIVVTGAAAVTLDQKRNAERQRMIAANTANTMVFQVADTMSRMSGPTEARLEILIQAEKVFDQVKTERTSRELETRRAEANRALAQTYLLLGDVARSHERIRLADHLLRTYAEAPDATTDELSTYGSILVGSGDVLSSMKKSTEATAAWARATTFLERASRRPDAKLAVRGMYALSLTRQADRLYSAGQYGPAEQLFRKALELQKAVVTAAPANPSHWARYATSLERMADCSYYSGRAEESYVQYDEALRIREESVRRNPDDIHLRSGLAIAFQNSAFCAEEQGQIPNAIARYRKGLDIQRRIVRDDPSNAVTLGNFMGGLAQLASTHHRAGDLESAVSLLEEAARANRAYRERYDPTPALIVAAANNAQILAETLTKMNRHDEAQNALQAALADFESLHLSDPASVDHIRNIASVELSFVSSMRRRGDRQGALAHARRAVEKTREAAQSGLATDVQEVARALYELGSELHATGDRADATRAVGEARGILLGLRAKNQLSPGSEGARLYLPEVEKLYAKLR